MCNQNQPANPFYRLPVEAEVLRRVAAGDMFTAYDVSKAVQAQGVRARHNDMKHVVHEMYAAHEMGGDYGRTMVKVGSGQQAFLYHPNTANPKTYAAGLQAAALLVGSNGVGGSAAVPQNAVVRFLDKYFRLRLPAPVLRQAGAAPGDTVFVAVDKAAAQIAVSAAAQSGGRGYRVDCYGNIRVTVGQSVNASRFAIAVDAAGEVTATPV